MKTFDYIIVGAGSAGCVLANRLSANPSFSVCLIEAGGPDKDPTIHMPLGYGKSLHNPKLSWNFFTQPDPHLGGRRLPLPRGKTLGGSSSLNGMIYIRGQAEDYNSWASLGCTGWGWEDILPYFIKLENYEEGETGLHGNTGPLTVSRLLHHNETNEHMVRAFEQYGMQRTDNFNGSNQEGVGFYDVTIKKGKRCSTTAAYLNPARKRKNLTILTGAMTTKVEFDGLRAARIKIQHKGEENTLAAHKDILLSAGAYQSPHLLHLSGIGDGAYLNSIGIDVVHDLPAVGENLQDHYMAPMAWEINPGFYTYNDQLSGLALLKNVLKYYAFKKGPMTIPAASVGAFMKSHSALDRCDLQFHCLAISGDLETASRGENSKLTDYPGLTIGGAQMRPESRGWVRAGSNDPLAHPHIVHNYLSEDIDRSLTLKAMHIAREVVKMPSLASVIKMETLPGLEAESDEEMISFQKELGTTMYHPVGSCRMGSDAKAVVTPQLKVNGVEGLRVIDASIMPRLVSGNTNAATIAIAEKGADLILQSR